MSARSYAPLLTLIVCSTQIFRRWSPGYKITRAEDHHEALLKRNFLYLESAKNGISNYV